MQKSQQTSADDQEGTLSGLDTKSQTAMAVGVAEGPVVRPKQKQTEVPPQRLPRTKKAMSLRCRMALQKAHESFVKDLDVLPAIDFLFARSILTLEDSKRIRGKQGDHEKRRVLLELLPAKGQRAYKMLSEFVSKDQPWLLDNLITSFNSITADELAQAEEEAQHHASDKGPTRQQLQEILRNNLLNYIENDPSQILPGSDTGDYLIQPIIADIETARQTDRHDATNMFRLLETSPTGQRIFVYGTAGMGKSTLCRNLARSWIDRDSGLGDRYDYLIPIPLRSVRSRNLVDVICDDVKLVPRLFKETLQEEMALNPGKVLFLLDSFEEFVHSGEKEEINKLIKGIPSDSSFLENSVVLITSRPHPEVKDLEQKVSPCISAQLQELPEQLIDQYIDSYPNLGQHAKTTVRQRFGGTFLKRPINLWLFCCVMVAIAKAGGSLAIPTSQTVLLNLIVQHILQAFLKKKNLHSFKLTNGSPLNIAELPIHAKSLLREAGRLCYFAVKENTTLMKVTGEIVSTDDLLAMGLFAAGSDDNTVVLPHQLFKEYLAALYLSSDETARNNLLKQIEDVSFSRELDDEPSSQSKSRQTLGGIRKKLGKLFSRARSSGSDPHDQASEPAHSSPRPCLVYILKSRGLDNVVRFLVGLLPAIANQLTNLFVIEQSRARIVTKLTGPGIRAIHEENKSESDYKHSFLHYEIDLFHECSHEIAKVMLAKALLDAEVIPDDGHSDYVPNRGSQLLLNYLTADERERFLAKFYNCQLLVIDGRPVLKVLGGGSSFLCDSFVAGFIVLHNCVVESEELWFYRAHLPVQIIAHHMADVRVLGLTDCMLYRDTAEFVTSLGLKDTPTDDMSEELATTSRSVVGFLSVHNVRGLRQLTSRYVMPVTRDLAVSSCDVTLAEVRQTFPAVSVLRLGGYDKDFLSAKTAWPSVQILTLTSFIDPIDLTDVHRSFLGLEELEVTYTTVLTDDRQTDPQTLRQLTLDEAHLKHETVSLSREKAIKILSRIYPQAEVVLEDYQDEEEAAYQIKLSKASAKALEPRFPDQEYEDGILPDPQMQRLYEKACLSGKRTVLQARLMLIGRFAAGKSSLKRSLLSKEFISEYTITPGIEGPDRGPEDAISVDQETALDWKPVPQDYKADLIRELVKAIRQTTANQEPTQPSNTITEALPYPDNEQERHEQEHSGRFDQQPPDNTATQANVDYSLSPATSDTQRGKQQATDMRIMQVQNKLKPMAMEITDCYSSLSKEELLWLTIWDFGGQHSYYTSHQAFLSNMVVYLLVTDITERLDECGASNEPNTPESAIEFLEFWLNSVHTHLVQRAGHDKDDVEPFIPPVIIVCTKTDKLDGSEEERERQILKYRAEMKRLLRQKPYFRHIVDIIAVTNRLPEDKGVENLRLKIVDTASTLPYWKKPRPIKWLLLLLELKQQADLKMEPIITMDGLHQEASECNVPIEEVPAFLTFHHNLGDLVFFPEEDTRDAIILSPQWLASVFSNVITKDEIYRQEELSDTQLADLEQGILSEKTALELVDRSKKLKGCKPETLLKIMEKFDILISCKIMPEVGTSTNEYIVPCLLPPYPKRGTIREGSCPRIHFKFVPKTICERKGFEKCGFLPQGLFHRIVARCSRVEGWTCQVNAIWSDYVDFDMGGFVLSLDMVPNGISLVASNISEESGEDYADALAEKRTDIMTVIEAVVNSVFPNLMYVPYLECDCEPGKHGFIQIEQNTESLAGRVPCSVHAGKKIQRERWNVWFGKQAVRRGERSGASNGMTDEHKDILEKNRPILIDRMTVSPVMAELRASRVFTPLDNEDIEHKGPRNAQVGELLNQLIRKDDSAFGKLVAALEETNQQHLADLLK